MSADDLRQISKAIDGLIYPSESDVGFDLFQWGVAAGSARDQVKAHTRAGRTMQEVSVDDFFAALKTTDEAARFGELRRVMESCLSEVKVFRVGTIRVEIYLIGKTRAGQWAGVHTTSVET
jgi:hypothetical protein